MHTVKKLIEVALPVKEISTESVRDKSIRHGHISTLHLWWARRPLPICRAVVFASLVPDPDDPHCPPAFVEAVHDLLGKQQNPGDPYKPYADIPYTAVFDPVPDTPRNRLLAFIGKFSPEQENNLLQGRKSAPPKKVLSDFSLIKWESRHNEDLITKARKLIWVAHNAASFSPSGGGRGEDSRSYPDHAAAFDAHWAAIQAAEQHLYRLPDRHLGGPQVEAAQLQLDQALAAFLSRMPKVFDPFAGGGAIPLEAARLGCRSYGNDLNPVAHIIQKASLEYPQRYGKPITYTQQAYIARYGQAAYDALPAEYQSASQHSDGTLFSPSGGGREEEPNHLINLPNRLAHDVQHYAHELLRRAEAEIGHYYPAVNGKKPIAYYWARVARCANPACQAEVPLLKQFYLVKKAEKKVHLFPIIEGTNIQFEVRHGAYDQPGWVRDRKNLYCPCCGQTTPNKELKRQFLEEKIETRLLAVIEEGESGKAYRNPTREEASMAKQVPLHEDVPIERLPIKNTKQFDLCPWGFTTVGSMFSPRQLLALQTLVKHSLELQAELRATEDDYGKAVATYLGVLVDRVAAVQTSFGRWHISGEKLEHPFSRQAIPMVFDYPESYPFGNVTGSANNQLAWVIRYINEESEGAFPANCINASSGDISQFAAKDLQAVVTDPPYYDAIAYADLSDFFYVWMKRSMGMLYPMTFAFPQTPKGEECTALKHHHGSDTEAKAHFERKLLAIFHALEQQVNGVVAVMFAHQTTAAWTTLCNSLVGANMNIEGAWPMDTEMSNRSVGLAGAALESSVTVTARPTVRSGFGSYREIKREIEAKVKQQVDYLYEMGFRGADLLTACFGQAVAVFGQYQRVEKADGTEVTVAELLELARDSAFNALVTGLEADGSTRFYLGWLQLFGFSPAEHDDVRRISQIGLHLEPADLSRQALLVQHGKQEHLASYPERLAALPRLGLHPSDPLIDRIHRALHLYAGTDRQALLDHLKGFAAQTHDPAWRVLTSLKELLPPKTEDHQQVEGLLANQESLIRAIKEGPQGQQTQADLQ